MDTFLSKAYCNIIKGNLKQRWPELTNDDLQDMNGDQDALMRRIQKRTGETRATVEAAVMAYRVALTNGNLHRRIPDTPISEQHTIN